MKHTIVALGCALIAAGSLAAQPAPAQSKRPLCAPTKRRSCWTPLHKVHFSVTISTCGAKSPVKPTAPISGTRAAIWRHGRVTPLPELEGTVSSSVLAINDLGDAVGLDTTSTANGVYWHRGTVQSMGTPDPEGYFFPTRLNNRGQAIGFTGLSYYLWQGGQFTPLEPGPGARNAVAEDINLAGHVAGWDVDTESTARGCCGERNGGAAGLAAGHDGLRGEGPQ